MAFSSVCQLCGSPTEGASRCSGCKEVWYCCKEHQRTDWSKGHKHICKYVKEHPEAVFIHVDALEGNGLSNRMVNHTFKSKQDGLMHVFDAFQASMSRPLRSQFAELLGWRLEIYCKTNQNSITSGVIEVSGVPGFELNGAGIYLGCSVQSGISRFNNLCGEIYVCGRRVADGKPLVSDSLWGILNFIWDAMDLYGEEEDPMPTIVSWAKKYQQGTWGPLGGTGGANVYATDVVHCNVWKDKGH